MQWPLKMRNSTPLVIRRVAVAKFQSIPCFVSSRSAVALPVWLMGTYLTHRPRHSWHCTLHWSPMDDGYAHNMDALRHFPKRFLLGQSQADDALDSYSRLLRELPDRFDEVQANLMLASSLNFISSLVLDHDLQYTAVSSSTHSVCTTFMC